MTENADKIIEGLCVYIMELESLRLPINVGFTTPYSRGTYFDLRFRRNRKFNFIRNSPDLHQKIQSDLGSYSKNSYKFRLRDIALFFISFFVTTVVITLLVIISKFVSNRLLIIIASWFISFGFIYFLFWIYAGHKRVIGEKYDGDIKGAIQELIDYGVEFVRENDLDPEDFPIKLKNNDYDGLSYEKRDENYYLGYFRK